eukprot:2753934-Rhodomonas_salina.2
MDVSRRDARQCEAVGKIRRGRQSAERTEHGSGGHDSASLELRAVVAREDPVGVRRAALLGRGIELVGPDVELERRPERDRTLLEPGERLALGNLLLQL